MDEGLVKVFGRSEEVDESFIQVIGKSDEVAERPEEVVGRSIFSAGSGNQVALEPVKER